MNEKERQAAAGEEDKSETDKPVESSAEEHVLAPCESDISAEETEDTEAIPNDAC